MPSSTMPETEKSVAFICNPFLVSECDRLPTMLNRATMIQDLINSYDLLENRKVLKLKSVDATEEDLRTFHSSSYVDLLKTINSLSEEELEEFDQSELLGHGLGYDCPPLPRLLDFSKSIAGGSLTAAEILNSGDVTIAVNWCGGWHHAQRDSAEGFCYVNDIVIAIQKLQEKYKKVLYVDLDVHHGNGVQNAFEASPRIVTLSFHKFSPGFYPGSGGLAEVGSGNGKFHTVNVPLMHGIGPDTYDKVFSCVFPAVYGNFQPDAVVVQCGADSLNGDPVGECNLTTKIIGDCLKKILECEKPTLVLGGGGYNFANTARLWTFLTAVILGVELDNDIPDSSQFFTVYAPSYEIHVEAGLQKDPNSESYINELLRTIEKRCKILVN